MFIFIQTISNQSWVVYPVCRSRNKIDVYLELTLWM